MADRTLIAVADSVQLSREAEGPAGGPETREHLRQAVNYYTNHYGRYAPSVLADEIHRVRRLIVDMLTVSQRERDRTELRRLAGWLSALLGNLAFHRADYAGAHTHLGTACGLGTSIGENRLTGWTLGARSMVAGFEHRPDDALDLAAQAHEYATTPLHTAQIAAWCELRALAALGRRADATAAATRAQQAMDSAEDEPGRFGFDRAELHQHLAEATLRLGDTHQAASHADAARSLKTTGSGGWAAAIVIRARAAAADHAPSDANALATLVLDTVPPDHLRETTRQRLIALDQDLQAQRWPGTDASELHERLRALPAHPSARRSSPEPNGDD
ncbi:MULTISPECIES: hypothetical protein [unclassified Actinopolyspora]|uniref:hypothetical protein n=1 Tax=unclassified Actinopolyspora TaxID=2639451 RepID=UPI0013F69346|nr:MULTISPECIES: hypothetical protein [unclassified Actinopolyspora]NHD16011.1 hypothetical protein [Actinopolyspora sp. BKK2]NHE74775.1 hypothetical protein [Actinopolyspora sp. BKK1]